MKKTVIKWTDLINELKTDYSELKLYPQDFIIHGKRTHRFSTLVIGTKKPLKIESLKDEIITTFIDSTTETMTIDELSFYSNNVCVLQLVSIDETDYVLIDGVAKWPKTINLVEKLEHIQLITEGNTRLDRIAALLSLPKI